MSWYSQGLRFECTGCGKCCTGAPGLVWVEEAEIEPMAKELGLSPLQFQRQYLRRRQNRWALVEKKKAPHDCIFLKDKKCQVYTARPIQCRSFPWWKENLNSIESWHEAAKFCEGIHPDAPLIPFSQIEASLYKEKA